MRSGSRVDQVGVRLASGAVITHGGTGGTARSLTLAGGDGPRLTEQIKGLRRSIAADLGFVLPPVRIRDNMKLGPAEYAISVKEIEAGPSQGSMMEAWYS